MKRKLLTMLFVFICTIIVYGQQDEKYIKRIVLGNAVGTWRMSNDTITFLLHLKKCKVVYGSSDTVEGVCGTYKVIKNIKEEVILEGNSIKGSNVYTDFSRYSKNTIGISFYDETMKKSTFGTINIEGDTLYWNIRPSIDSHPVTVNGKVISNPQYPKGWSVPISAMLYRVKEEAKE